MSKYIKRDYKENFESKIIPVPESGCWLWTGCTNKLGYGQVRHQAKMKYAHRVSWKIYKGDIPEGMCVLHKCDMPACVNPDHLFLGTHKENTQDSMRKGRWIQSPEKRAKVSAIHKGKKISKETLKRMSEAKIGSNHPRARPVTFEGELYPTISAAMLATGYNYRKISRGSAYYSSS